MFRIQEFDTLIAMQLFKSFEHLSEAELVAMQMRNKGIMTHVANRNSKNLGAIGAGPLQIGLWVVLDEQYEDARQLYDNPDHVVSEPLSEAQMRQLEAEVEDSRGLLSQHMLNGLMITIACGLLLWVTLTVLQ
jgi:hypothetical protein